MGITIMLVVVAYLIFHGALLVNWGGIPDYLSQADKQRPSFDDDDQDGIGTGSSLWDDDNSISSSTLLDDSSSIIDSSSCFSDSYSSINPANGLPMMGCVDIEGNPYGTDSPSHWDDCSSNSFLSEDIFCSSTSSSFDDSFCSSSFSSSSFDD